MYHKNDLEAAL